MVRATRLIPLFIGLCVAQSSWSASLQISPTSIKLDDTIQQIKIENKGTERIVLETLPMLWSQPNGNDQLTGTDEVVSYPPVVAIAPGTAAVVRVAGQEASHHNFRLLLRELKQEASNTPSIQMTYSLPVFVNETGNAAVVVTNVDRQLGHVTLKNVGQSHLKITGIRFDDGEQQSVLFYILPGVQRTFEIPQAIKKLTVYGENGFIYSTGI